VAVNVLSKDIELRIN